jgi:hypothetical protein
MNRRRVLLILSGIILVLTLLVVWQLNRSRVTEEQTFSVAVGDRMSITYYENGSTGFVNCWINESLWKHVRLVNEAPVTTIFDRTNCGGCGSAVEYTFEATSPGTDTIKMKDCPVYISDKGCDYFSVETLRNAPDSVLSGEFRLDTIPDRYYIITVTEEVKQ